jgi:hypothetical protein
MCVNVENAVERLLDPVQAKEINFGIRPVDVLLDNLRDLNVLRRRVTHDRSQKERFGISNILE